VKEWTKIYGQPGREQRGGKKLKGKRRERREWKTEKEIESKN
jgi:hypothetical protein